MEFYYGLLNEVTNDRVLFDALMVEKIKTYSLHFDAPAILADELHEMYLKESVYDDEELK